MGFRVENERNGEEMSFLCHVGGVLGGVRVGIL